MEKEFYSFRGDYLFSTPSFNILWLLILFSSLPSCGPSPSLPSVSSQDIFQDAPPDCSDFVIKDQFLVHWKNGSLTLESAHGIEDFKSSFLKNHAHQIVLAEPNYRIPDIHWERIAADEETCQETSLKHWGFDNINALQAWEQGAFGQNIVIAIIDSGVDIHHPQLQDNIFINSQETGTDHKGLDKAYNGIDDDNNGYIDDVNGYDFINLSPYPIDNLGHGTHVAGIIAAQDMGAPSTGSVRGVAPSVTLLPLKFMDDYNGGNIWSAIKAIDYAAQMGAHVINASWGGAFCSTNLKERIAGLQEQNILFVSAAGNSSQDLDQAPLYPASYDLPSQITVGALQPPGNMALFSNYGSKSVHIFAPGENIFSTAPIYFGSFTSCANGTSMATPFVSGAAALLWSHYLGASAIDIKNAILSSATPNNNHNEMYNNRTQGRLDLSKALYQLPTSLSDPLWDF